MPFTPEERRARKRASDKAYFEKNRERIVARMRAYRLAHLEEEKANHRAYRLAHLEEDRAKKHADFRAHPEKQQARVRAWGLRHPGAKTAYSRTYRAKYPERTLEVSRIQVSQRRARKRQLPATLTILQWEAILVAYKGRCAYCGKKAPKLTQDHVVPVSKGGGYTAENIVPACKSCNSRKGGRLLANPPPLRLML